MEHFLYKLEKRFPRLQEVEFSYSDNDSFSIAFTPAGIVEVIYFYERADFENALIALAYKLEKRTIPQSLGAMYIEGLVDREKNCRTTLILLSRGAYSAVDADSVGLNEAEWLDKSFIIRKNHELAHFIQRKLYPDNKNTLKNEIKADMVGLIAAFGSYQPHLAKLFLGTEGSSYREGGRLQNYADESTDMSLFMKTANDYINQIYEQVNGRTDPFRCLIDIEEDADISCLSDD